MSHPPARFATHVLLALIVSLSYACTRSLPDPEGNLIRAGIRVHNAWSRATPPGAEEAVVYLQLKNSGAPDRLTGLRSDISEGAGLHETSTRDGMTGMRAVPVLELPTGATLALSPGGMHVMLTGLRRPLAEGDRFPLFLQFAGAGEQQVEVVVAGMGALGPEHMHH